MCAAVVSPAYEPLLIASALTFPTLLRAGSFDGWRPWNLRRGSQGKDCIRSIALPPGQYQVSCVPLTAGPNLHMTGTEASEAV